MSQRLMLRQIFNREILQTLDVEYSRKFLVTLVSRLIAAFSSLFFGVFVARTLGPDNTGIFYFCLTMLIGLSFLARLGQEVNIIWHASRASHDQDYSHINGLVLLCLALSLFSSIGLAGLVWVLKPLTASFLHSEEMAGALALLILALPAVSMAYIFSGCLKGVGKTGEAALLEQGGVFLLSLIALFLLWTADCEFTLSLVLLSFVSCSYLVTLFGAWWWFAEVPLRWNRLGVHWPDIPGFLASSINMGLVSLFTYVMQFAPLILLGVLSDQRQVGMYAVGDRLVVVQYFILSIVMVVVVQKLSTSFYKKDLQEFRQTANRAALLSGLGALPIAVLLLVFPTWCLGLFGDGFEGAESILQLLCLAYLTSVILAGGGYMLMIAGHESTLRNIQFVSMLLLLALDSLLIPASGAKGAALAALIVYSLKYIVTNYTVKKLLGFYVVPRW